MLLLNIEFSKNGIIVLASDRYTDEIYFFDSENSLSNFLEKLSKVKEFKIFCNDENKFKKKVGKLSKKVQWIINKSIEPVKYKIDVKKPEVDTEDQDQNQDQDIPNVESIFD